MKVAHTNCDLRAVGDFTGYVQKYMDGELKVDEFISHKFGLDKINDAFHVMHEVRQCGAASSTLLTPVMCACVMCVSEQGKAIRPVIDMA